MLYNRVCNIGIRGSTYSQNLHTKTKNARHIGRQTQRQTGKKPVSQTDGQLDRQIDNQTDFRATTQSDKHKVRSADRQTDRQTERHTDSQQRRSCVNIFSFIFQIEIIWTKKLEENDFFLVHRCRLFFGRKKRLSLLATPNIIAQTDL